MNQIDTTHVVKTPLDMPLREISAMLAKKQISATELLDLYLKIALKGSCITFCHENAVKMSAIADTRRYGGERLSPLFGLPFSVKDNILTKGVATTCNSKILKENVPDTDAPEVRRLLDLGAILSAKNCMREFSVGKIEDSAYDIINYLVWQGTTKNVNIGAFSLATDIGVCENYCGLWAYKPSTETNVTQSIITGAPSLERVTLLARSADDMDFVSSHLYNDNADVSVTPKNLKVLVHNDLNMPTHVAELLEKAGFSVEICSLPILDDVPVVYDIIMRVEFYTNLLRLGKPEYYELNAKKFEIDYLKSRIDGIGLEVKKYIISGAHLLMEKNAQKTREILDYSDVFVNELNSLLLRYDFIAAPLHYDDKLSKASGIANLPEITVPFADMLPFKIITTPSRQRELLKVAKILENVAGF